MKIKYVVKVGNVYVVNDVEKEIAEILIGADPNAVTNDTLIQGYPVHSKDRWFGKEMAYAVKTISQKPEKKKKYPILADVSVEEAAESDEEDSVN